MKKIFITILFLVFILPIAVYADNSVDTSFNEDTCTLTVSGEEIGHDAAVSLYVGDELKGYKTGPIDNGQYAVDYVLVNENEATYKVIVTDEDGHNSVTRDNVVVPACYLSPIVFELPDENDREKNSIIIKDHDVGFPRTSRFYLDIYDEAGLDAYINGMQGTEGYDFVLAIKNRIIEEIGDYRQLAYYFDIHVRDSQNQDISYDGYNQGFKIKMKVDSATYQAMNGLKFAEFFYDTFRLGDELEYSYDEENEVLTIHITQLGILVVYFDNDYEMLDNTADPSYNVNNGSTVLLRVNADRSKFKAVFLDGGEVNPNNYTITTGSTSVTFKEDYLKSLSLGSHTVVIYFEDGSSTTSIVIVDPTKNPNTSDLIYHNVRMLLISILGFVITTSLFFKINYKKN